MQAVQIRNVTSHKEGCDLPFPVAGMFGRTEQAIQNDKRTDRTVPLTHQVIVGQKILLLDRDALQNVDVGLSNIRDAQEFADKYIRG